MSEFELAKNAPEVSRRSLLLRQTLPYIAVLTLAILGVAYTNISHQPLTGYWEFLALATGVLCVVTAGVTKDRQARLRLMGRQALHWGGYSGHDEYRAAIVLAHPTAFPQVTESLGTILPQRWHDLAVSASRLSARPYT
jgi:hypothetical protein